MSRQKLLSVTIPHRHVVRSVTDINAGRIRMHHLQTEVFGLNFPRHLPSPLVVHLVPTGGLRAMPAACGVLLFRPRLVFPEPCLVVGQERTREDTALTVKPGCSGIKCCQAPKATELSQVTLWLALTAPKGAARACAKGGVLCSRLRPPSQVVPTPFIAS
jgi:hypothetical protein